MFSCYRDGSFNLGALINSLYENPILMVAFVAIVGGSSWYIWNRKKTNIQSDLES